jgi:MFS family permease
MPNDLRIHDGAARPGSKQEETAGAAVGHYRITATILGNGLLRIASSANGVMIGFFVAYLARSGRPVGAALVGGLSLVTSLTELAGAVPIGALADRFSARSIMVTGALIGAFATQLFGITGVIFVFFFSRALEGVAAVCAGPPLLAHLTDVTQSRPQERGRVMGFFELSLLAGVALGGLVAGLLWDAIKTYAFSTLAAAYALAALLFYIGAGSARRVSVPTENPLASLRSTLSDPLLRRLAPAWLALNAIIGLWLSQMSFQLNGPHRIGQYLAGHFTPGQVGEISLAYTLVFAGGVTAWGFLLSRLTRLRALQISLSATLPLCLWLFLLNESIHWAPPVRWVMVALIAVTLMVESGFTPAALAYLADVAGRGESRGSAMGVYTLLLGAGNVLGATLGTILGQYLAFNGLVLGTLLLAVFALASLALLREPPNGRVHRVVHLPT